jgi:hypothetical protein
MRLGQKLERDPSHAMNFRAYIRGIRIRNVGESGSRNPEPGHFEGSAASIFGSHGHPAGPSKATARHFISV